MKVSLNRQIVGNVYWFTPDQKIHVSTLKPYQVIAEPERLTDEQIDLMLEAVDKGMILIDKLDILHAIKNSRKSKLVDAAIEKAKTAMREPQKTQEDL